MMRVSVLMENESAFPYLTGEHGLSLFIETSRHRLILDTGQSEKTWENARRMGVDFAAADCVIVSHGHYDHTGGLALFSRENPSVPVYIREESFGEFYRGKGERYIGVPEEVAEIPALVRVKDPVLPVDGGLLLFSGVKPQSVSEKLTEKRGNIFVPDEFSHEQNIVVTEGEERVLFCGCAHCGVLSVMEKCREVTGAYPTALVGGFHMKKEGEYTPEEVEKIEKTAEKLLEYPTAYYTGHCTGQAAEILRKKMGDRLKRFRAGDVFRP